MKNPKEWKGSLVNRRERKGLGAKSALFPLLPPVQNRGRGWRGAGGANPGGQRLGGGSGVGEKGEREPRG